MGNLGEELTLYQTLSVPNKKVKVTNTVVVTRQGRYTMTYTNKSEQTWEITIVKEGE